MTMALIVGMGFVVGAVAGLLWGAFSASGRGA